MAKSNDYFYGLGRRKSATARARLTGGKGIIVINGKPAEEYLDGNTTLLAELTDPLALIGKQKEFVVTVDLGVGQGRATVYTCDLSHEYVSINADYRT